MTDTTYNWKRYWVPRDGGFSFDSDGFLNPPSKDAQGFAFWKTDIIAFEELLTKPCLVLLGEPGIGKSHAIRDAELRARAAIAGHNAKFLVRDLGSFTTDSFLVEQIFESTEFRSWQESGGELHVFLDSFDECLFRVDTAASLLADYFGRLSTTQNLFLRIASRTAEWRTGLETALRDKWGKDATGVYELAPLTRSQVTEAAVAHLEDPERFIKGVITSEVVSFAIKPLTLNLLLRVWENNHGALPATQREIYGDGCRELCTDFEKRQTPAFRRRLTADQRLEVASHIMAALILCNRTAVWTNPRLSGKPTTDISLSELATGVATSRGIPISVTEEALREAIDTGLFTSRGQDRLSWAHQTFGEFLAARYLTQIGLSSQQVGGLLFHWHESEHKLVPQLQEVAAWVASANEDVFRQLTRSQPEVLLRSDVATADVSSRTALVDALLAAHGQDSILGNWWDMRKRYRKLNHPKLVPQLSQCLSNRSLPAQARCEAVSIAEACEVTALCALFVKLALDAKEALSVRQGAAAWIARSGDQAAKKRLRPLALGMVGADPKDELRGAGLKACWPKHLSASELFTSLKESEHHWSGTYKEFLSSDLVEGLTEADLPTALAWTESQRELHHTHPDHFSRLIFGILNRSVAHWDKPAVFVPFARALLVRLRKRDFSTWSNDSPLAETLKARPDLCLKLVETAVPFFADPEEDALRLTRYGLRLLGPRDMPWLVIRLRSANDEETRAGYFQLIRFSFYPEDVECVDVLVEAARDFPVLAEIMSHWLKPVHLASEEARQAREIQRQTEGNERELAPKLLSPSPADRVVTLLEQFEAGNLEGWWKLCLWLEVKADGNYCERHGHMDVRDLDGWNTASDNTRNRMVAAALLYATGRDSKPEAWFTRKNIIHHPAVAGFRALLLLAHEASGQFQALSAEVWAKWSPAIFRIHHYDEADKHRLLTTEAFRRAPLEATEWALKVVAQENKEGDNLWIFQKLPEQWPHEFSNALLRRARRGRLKPKCTEQLWTALVEHKVPGAISLVRSRLPRKAPTAGPSRELSRHAARLLMLHGDRSDWPRVWRLFKGDPAFGREIMAGFGFGYSHSPAGILGTLSEPDVGLLWEWMLAQYPALEDPDRSKGGAVTDRMAMADMRDSLVSHLANLGTVAGCMELERLISKHPEFGWFRRVVMRGREQMRRQTWEPPSPKELFELANNQRARLVQSPAQLLEGIMESLTALQAKLSGDRQLARYLWDGKRPKSEEDISEWIAAHLEDDLGKHGLVVGREVQIHRYDETDVHVSAVRRDLRTGYSDTITVIIEVKGAWNNRVKKDMADQLANRYLKNSISNHGLYLVGWFPLAEWDDKDDGRRKQVHFASVNELRTQLEKQAGDLSGSQRTIRAFVVDFSRRQPAKRRSGKSGRNRRA